MHHKRKGPKSTRAGCLICKPHKAWGNRREARTVQELRKTQDRVRDAVADYESDHFYDWDEFPRGVPDWLVQARLDHNRMLEHIRVYGVRETRDLYERYMAITQEWYGVGELGREHARRLHQLVQEIPWVSSLRS